MNIGELGRVTGVSTRLLRYYEQQGLLQSGRAPNGYRSYALEAVDRVVQVRGLLASGLPTAVIRDVLPCTGPAGAQADACPGLLTRIAHIRDEVRARAAHLAETGDALDKFLTAATALADDTVGTSHGRVPSARRK